MGANLDRTVAAGAMRKLEWLIKLDSDDFLDENWQN